MRHLAWPACFLALAALALTPPGDVRAGKKDKDKAAKKAKQEPEQKAQVIEGQLDAKDQKDKKTGGPSKTHTVKLAKGQAYVIDLRSKDQNFDPYLRLLDAKGEVIAEDDDGAGLLGARILFAPDAGGEYQLVATSHDRKAGKYVLKVQEAKLEPKQLDVGKEGATVKGQLTPKTPKSLFGFQNRYQMYTAELKAGQAYVVELQSEDFDAFVRVHGQTFKTLATDDDTGKKRNARVRFTPPRDGLYVIVATGLGDPEGSYTLSVRPEAKKKD